MHYRAQHSNRQAAIVSSRKAPYSFDACSSSNSEREKHIVLGAKIFSLRKVFIVSSSDSQGW